MNCELCSSLSIETFSAIPHDVAEPGAVLSIKHCLDCGLAWQFPRYRTPEESVTRHLDRYNEREEGSYYDPERRRAVVGTELSFVETLFDAPAALLDIGAGDGTFVAHAATKGWTCTGVDPAARASPDLPVPKAGSFRLVQGTLANLDPTDRFDAITLWDVIEHLDDPEAVLLAAIPLLKDQGILIVETGNFQSAERISAGPDWWAYAADHRWYFAPPTLRQLLHRAGLPHVALANRVLRPWWRGKHFYAGPPRGQTLKTLVRSPFSAPTTLRRYRLLRDAAVDWKQWGGLSIFALVASRLPIDSRTASAGLIPL